MESLKKGVRTYNAVHLMEARESGTTAILVGIVEESMIARIERAPDGVGFI